jgi:hypothetical protein
MAMNNKVAKGQRVLGIAQKCWNVRLESGKSGFQQRRPERRRRGQRMDPKTGLQSFADGLTDHRHRVQVADDRQ